MFFHHLWEENKSDSVVSSQQVNSGNHSASLQSTDHNSVLNEPKLLYSA